MDYTAPIIPEEIMLQEGLRPIPACLVDDAEIQAAFDCMTDLLECFKSRKVPDDTTGDDELSEEKLVEKKRKKRRAANKVRRSLAPAVMLVAYTISQRAYIYGCQGKEQWDAVVGFAVAYKMIVLTFHEDASIRDFVRPYSENVISGSYFKYPTEYPGLPELRVAIINNHFGLDFDFEQISTNEAFIDQNLETLQLATLQWKAVRLFLALKETRGDRGWAYLFLDVAEIDEHLQQIAALIPEDQRSQKY